MYLNLNATILKKRMEDISKNKFRNVGLAVIASFFIFTNIASATISDNEYYGPRRLIQSENQDTGSSSSGAFVYDIPITTPPGRNGIEPSLGLSYNSQNLEKGNLFGYGWGVEIPSIQRLNKLGINKMYSSNDFVSSLSGELESVLLVDGKHGEYGSKIDSGEFIKYSYSSTTDGWTAIDKKGTIYTFGTSSNSKQSDPNDSTKTYKWLLKEIRDLNGNYMAYEYFNDNGQIYPYKIKYTGNSVTDGIFEVEFLREERNDKDISYSSGFLIKTLYRINEIQVKINGSWIRKYNLGFTSGDNTKRSLLSSVTETGKDESGNTLSLPQSSFTYQGSNNGWTEDTAWVFPEDLDNTSVFVVDINADSFPDVIRSEYSGGTNYYTIWINDGFDGFSNETVNWSLPVALSDSSGSYAHTFLVDVNGDGFVDILSATENSTSRKVYINNGNDTGWTINSNYVIPFDLESGGSPDHSYRLMDVNGDGLIDAVRSEYAGIIYDNIYINNGNDTGWTEDSNWSVPVYFSSGGVSYDKRIFDVNGDNLPDIVRSEIVGATHVDDVYINNGFNGWDLDNNWSVPVDFSNQGAGQRQIDIADVNADGLNDLIDSHSDPQYRKVYLNKGDGVGWLLDSSFLIPIDFKSEDVRIFDINGDGMIDFNSVDTIGGTRYDKIYENNGEEVDLISQITTSNGAVITPEYKASGLYKDSSNVSVNSIPFAIDTVSSITTNDGNGNVLTNEIFYENGFYNYENPSDRKFAGFSKISNTDTSGNIVKNYYHQGDSSDTSNGEYSDDDSKIGKIYRTEYYDNSNNKYSQIVYKWENYDLGNNRDFVKNTKTTQYQYDGNGTHKDTATEYVYDNTYGNVTSRTDYGEVTATSQDGSFTDTGSDKLTTDYTYALNTTDYIVGLASKQTVKNQSNSKISEIKNYYDTLSLDSVNKGNLTKQETWESGANYLDIEKTYNSYGLIVTEKDPRNKTTSYSYDSYNLYPKTVTNPKNQSTQYTYDYSSGKIKLTTDPNSRQFETTYDAFDRPKQINVPDLSSPSTLVAKTQYTYTDSGLPRKVQETNYLDASNSFDIYRYYDGLGRLIQTRKEAESSGVFSVTDQSYHENGQILKKSLPYFSNGLSNTSMTTNSSLLKTYSYDPLDRIKTQTDSSGIVTYSYDDWKKTIVDQMSKQKDYHSDAYGNLVKVTEYINASPYYTNY